MLELFKNELHCISEILHFLIFQIKIQDVRDETQGVLISPHFIVRKSTYIFIGRTNLK